MLRCPLFLGYMAKEKQKKRRSRTLRLLSPLLLMTWLSVVRAFRRVME